MESKPAKIESPVTLGWCLFIASSLVVASVIFCLWFPSPRHALIGHDTTLLFPYPERQLPLKQVSEHNSNLITFLHANLARESSDISVMANTKSQTRLFYVAIAAALITLLAVKDVKLNAVTVGGPMFLIVSMYALEIYQDDLNRRSTDSYYVEVHASEMIVDLNPNETTWYVKDGRLLGHVETSLHKRSFYRKYLAFCNPSTDQFILYMVPFLFVYVPTLWRTRAIWDWKKLWQK